MALLYGRRVRLVVGTVEIESDGNTGLRVSFDVGRALKRSANTMRVEVYNLSYSTRTALDEAAAIKTRSAAIVDPESGEPVSVPDPGVGVVLEAGYEETMGGIFAAAGPFITHRRDGVDWITTIESQDGLDILREDISFSMGRGVSGRQVINKMKDAYRQRGIQAAFEAGVDSIGDAFDVKVYPGGKTFAGKGGDLIAELAEDAGLEFSIQDRVVQFLKPGEALKAPAVVLSADSGLIHSPQRVRDPKRPNAHIMKGVCFLMPELVPGRQIQLESVSESGNFKVTEVGHKGDTHGDADSWTSDWEAIAL